MRPTAWEGTAPLGTGAVQLEASGCLTRVSQKSGGRGWEGGLRDTWKPCPF